MATYTVIQDIEAEDKFLGPLTLKQFIFGASGVFFGYLSVFAMTKGVPILLVIIVPPALLGFFLAIPWSSEQPTELWVLAKLRFRLKPKTRVWNQSGLEELVTITAPKKVEKHRTNGLNQTEVQSRLKALAETIDSRGWATKHSTLPQAQNTVYGTPSGQDSQRLIDIDEVPHEVPDVDLRQYEDVMDDNTVVSEHFTDMIQTSSSARRQESLDKMERVRQGEPLDTVRQPEVHFTPPAEPYSETTAAYEENLSQQLQDKRNAVDLANSHMQQFKASTSSVVQDDTSQPGPATVQPQAQMTNTPDPAIINLANNNDLDVATISRVAKDEEVVISLR